MHLYCLLRCLGLWTAYCLNKGMKIELKSRKHLARLYIASTVFTIIFNFDTTVQMILLYIKEQKEPGKFWPLVLFCTASSVLEPYFAVCVWAWKQEGENIIDAALESGGSLPAYNAQNMFSVQST